VFEAAAPATVDASYLLNRWSTLRVTGISRFQDSPRAQGDALTRVGGVDT